MTTFYCLRFEISQPGGGPRIYIPQEQGVPVIPPGNGPLSSLSMTRRNTVEIFDPASTWECLVMTADLRVIASARTAQKTPLTCSLVARETSTELFPSNGCCTVARLQSCYLAMGLHVTISLRCKTRKGMKFKLCLITLGPALLC
jgi:hypothetical protein